MKSISKNDITYLGVSGCALRDACEIYKFKTKSQVLASAARVETADSLRWKMKENSGQVSSGVLVWRQTVKSADFETWQEKKRDSFPLQLVARPEQNESLGTRKLTSGSLESNELALHLTWRDREGMNI